MERRVKGTNPRDWKQEITSWIYSGKDYDQIKEETL